MMIIETAISNPHMVKSFVRFLCIELDIKPKRITVAEWEELESNVIGLCIDESEDEFIILVKEKTRNMQEMLVTIAHEMIHVKQHMKENLGWFLDNRGHIPYLKRWWEKEAFNNALPLYKKYINIALNSQKNVAELELFEDA